MNFEKVYNLFLGVLSGVFFFFPASIGTMIAILVLMVGFGIYKNELSFRFNREFIFPVLLYIVLLIGIIFTDNMPQALTYVENKLAFLVLPLIFSFQPKFELRISYTLIGSVIGISLASLYGIYNSFICIQEGGILLNCLTSVNISPIHHPTYFASFILVVNFGVWWTLKHKEEYVSLNWVLPFSLFSMVIFFLSMSLAAMLCLTILIYVLVLYWIRKRFGKVVLWIGAIFAPVILTIFLLNFPVIKGDLTHTKKAVVAYINDPVGYVESKPGYKTGNEIRLVMWTVTVLEIMDHPLGVGTGNVDASLSQRLEKHGQLDLAKQDKDGSIKYNPHNQYLQTGLEFGFVGLSLLILFLYSAIRKAVVYRNAFLFVITLSLVINAVFESMLQRQSGIVFYMFWICLMVVFSNLDQGAKVGKEN